MVLSERYGICARLVNFNHRRRPSTNQRRRGQQIDFS
jgi:hypothetical protein